MEPGFGVCRLSVVAVRQSPDYHAPLVTQLLFGDHYEVLPARQKHWINIRIHFDKTEGWIPSEQHHEISQEYFEQINHANYKITTDLTSNILYKKSPLTILMGSIVPISGSELFKMEEQFAFNGEAKSLGQRRDGEFVCSLAAKWLNAPELPGGRTPFGVDAAGFIQLLFKIAGYELPSTSEEQMMEGKSVALADARPGDLVFIKRVGDDQPHTSLLLRDQKVMHVDGQVRIDSLVEDSLLRADTKVCTHFVMEVRRMMHLTQGA